jgi:hypothetical protein
MALKGQETVRYTKIVIYKKITKQVNSSKLLRKFDIL